MHRANNNSKRKLKAKQRKAKQKKHRTERSLIVLWEWFFWKLGSDSSGEAEFETKFAGSLANWNSRSCIRKSASSGCADVHKRKHKEAQQNTSNMRTDQLTLEERLLATSFFQIYVFEHFFFIKASFQTHIYADTTTDNHSHPSHPSCPPGFFFSHVDGQSLWPFRDFPLWHLGGDFLRNNSCWQMLACVFCHHQKKNKNHYIDR